MDGYRQSVLSFGVLALLLAAALPSVHAQGPAISPSAYWKNQVEFPYDSFCARGTSKESVKWIKFTILPAPYDPNVVYFQDCRKYVFHYSFAAEVLDPFLGMTTQQFNAVSLFEDNQKAILGTVILPPAAVWPTEPQFREYGIQFVRQDPFTREQIRDLFRRVQSCISAPEDVQAFYFPTFEQQAVASQNSDWFASQGIALGSTARWAEGNACYAQGWAFGTLKFFPGDRIAEAYQSGLLAPGDILLTDGVPAEVPFVAGIVSLVPSTPNSHVAILARTYEAPFVHLSLAEDAQLAQELVGHRILLTAYDKEDGTSEVKLIDTDGLLDDDAALQIEQLKKPPSLQISPMASQGLFGVSTEDLSPADIRYVGGKASNFGMLRRAVPENSPRAVALTFDLWNAFLDQPLTPVRTLSLAPGESMLVWADGDSDQGPTHASFRLSKDGEWLGLYDLDGATLLDSIRFGPQTSDVSFGRSADGGGLWRSFESPTPGRSNSTESDPNAFRLAINEIMADNKRTIRDPCDSDQYPDWIELYNASQDTIVLNGLYLADDPNDPTRWQVPPAVASPTLREEISRRLSPYTSYPPSNMETLSQDLAGIRALFTNAGISEFSSDLRAAVIDVLTDPLHGFEPNAMLRFRSSTNVEDSADFIGAGLYDSYSGCLADAIDGDDDGPSACDPNRRSEKDLFRAIREVFASFYNNNAFLERLRHDVDEAGVGMAVVVHHSFPDGIELANGVATLEKIGTGAAAEITLVSQQGAVSVTNPEDGSTPEEVTASIYASGSVVPPAIKQASSLTRVGETVMAWNSEYKSLIDLLVLVSDEFARTTGKTQYTLDLEYKKVAPGGRILPEGGLVVKQVRPIPTSDDAQTPFLVNQPTEYEVYSGEVLVDASNETVDVFADHRLKSRWTLQTRSTTLDANALAEGLYTDVQIEYLDEDRIRTVSGPLSLLPSAVHNFQWAQTIDNWQWNDLEPPRMYALRTTDIPTSIPPSQRPILTLSDLGCSGYNVPYKFLTLRVVFTEPVASLSSTGPTTTTNEVYLWPRLAAGDKDIPQERSLSSNGVSIRSRFYYPPLPKGLSAWEFGGANTAPLKRWEQTTIEGLTAEPIVLTGYYSQTFRPEHHNLTEHFLFEPRLEPGIPPEILSQLRDLNVRFIHLIVDKDGVGGDRSRIATYGFESQ